MDSPALNWALAGIVVVLLSVASAVGHVLERQTQLGLNPATVKAFNSRLRAWWVICCLLAVAFLSKELTVCLFGLISFWALREFITLTPTRQGDHRALFFVFFFFTPLHYLLVYQNLYQFYSILIPVYGFLFIPLRVAIAGDPKRFLERVAKIQSGLLVCVYCLGFAPALLYLEGPTMEHDAPRSRLLFFLVLMALISEALQFAFDRLYGRNVIAPNINGTRTWEGMLGGSACAALLGPLLHVFTPFGYFWHTMLVSLLISIMGFAGAMTMSAIKRDRGVKDFGTLVEGHGGILDRIDTICFAAPVFYHVSRQLLHAS
jgi:phosphatidate cytidylyltransferase